MEDREGQSGLSVRRRKGGEAPGSFRALSQVNVASELLSTLLHRERPEAAFCASKGQLAAQTQVGERRESELCQQVQHRQIDAARLAQALKCRVELPVEALWDDAVARLEALEPVFSDFLLHDEEVERVRAPLGRRVPERHSVDAALQACRRPEGCPSVAHHPGQLDRNLRAWPRRFAGQ